METVAQAMDRVRLANECRPADDQLPLQASPAEVSGPNSCSAMSPVPLLTPPPPPCGGGSSGGGGAADGAVTLAVQPIVPDFILFPDALPGPSSADAASSCWCGAHAPPHPDASSSRSPPNGLIASTDGLSANFHSTVDDFVIVKEQEEWSDFLQAASDIAVAVGAPAARNGGMDGPGHRCNRSGIAPMGSPAAATLGSFAEKPRTHVEPASACSSADAYVALGTAESTPAAANGALPPESPGIGMLLGWETNAPAANVGEVDDGWAGQAGQAWLGASDINGSGRGLAAAPGCSPLAGGIAASQPSAPADPFAHCDVISGYISSNNLLQVSNESFGTSCMEVTGHALNNGVPNHCGISSTSGSGSRAKAVPASAAVALNAIGGPNFALSRMPGSAGNSSEHASLGVTAPSSRLDSAILEQLTSFDLFAKPTQRG